MQVRTKHRVLLTGTMFQNIFEELFNLLKLVQPNLLEVISNYATILSNKSDMMGKIDVSNEMHGICSTYTIEQRVFQEDFGNKIENESQEERICTLKNFKILYSPLLTYHQKHFNCTIDHQNLDGFSLANAMVFAIRACCIGLNFTPLDLMDSHM